VAIRVQVMKPLFTRLLRGAVLGMMLLLSAMASMVCFSYDADGDDSTPPVTVEFNGIVPSKKAIQISELQSIADTNHVRDVHSASPSTQIAMLFPSAQATDITSSQFVPPLRR
jgi:hypothetical protein